MCDVSEPPPPKRVCVAVMLVPLLMAIIGYWSIVVVDPYDLRPGGLSPNLVDGRYPDREWPLLINASTRGQHSLVLLGGSTTMGITPAMLDKAFPGQTAPLNLSYIAPRPVDAGVTMERIANIDGLKRVILVLDFTLMEARGFHSAAGEKIAYMQGTNWAHSGDFGPDTAIASLHRIVYGTYQLPWRDYRARPDFMLNAKPLTSSVTTLSSYREAVRAHSGNAFTSMSRHCDDTPYVGKTLAPFLRKMVHANVDVDILFPPTPYIIYYEWIANPPRFNILAPGPVFDQLRSFEKCAVETAAAIDNRSIRILALNVNDAVSGDLGRYMDSIHLLDPKAYEEVLTSINDPSNRVTPENFAHYRTTLQARVERFGQNLLSQAGPP